jgi:hypothetical protein
MRIVSSPKYGDEAFDGQVWEIGEIKGKNGSVKLAFHHYTNRYLVIQQYNSGKFNIDYLTRFDGGDKCYTGKYLTHTYKREIARKDKLQYTRILEIDGTKMAYVLRTFTPEKTYEVMFWLDEKWDYLA